MKKHLLKSLLALALVLITGNAWGETVTFVPTADIAASTDVKILTKDGITITVTDGTLGNGTDYRVYKSKTMTITSAIGDIANIALTYSSASYDGGGWTSSYQPNSNTWTSSIANGEQARITKIVVTTSGSDKVLASVAISGVPSKTTYEAGEEFDPTGLTVTGTYTEGDPEIITSGITWNITPFGALTAGTTSVSVTATVGNITSPAYEVNGLTITEHVVTPGTYDIALNNALWGTSYSGSQSISVNSLNLDGKGDDVAINLKNGSSTNCYINDDQTRAYNGYSLKFTVPADYELTSIVFTQVSGKDWKGTLSADKGEIEEDNKTWSGNSNNVTISFSGTCVIEKVTVTFAVKKTVSSIAVKTAPTKDAYYVGDNFNPAGLVITATYDKGDPEDIAYAGNENKFTFSPELTSALSITNNKVTITYRGKSVDQAITVNLNKLATPTNLEANATSTSVTLTWDAVENASSYEVTITDADTYDESFTPTTNSLLVEDLAAGTEYLWSVKAIGNNTTYADSDENGDGDFTTSALPTVAFTVSFNGNEHGTPASAEIEEASAGAGITLPDCNNVAEGYMFVGWCENQSGEGDVLEAGATFYPAEADITFFAIYKQVFTINYMVNGVNTNPQENVEGATALVFPEVSAPDADHVFCGWITEEINGIQATAPEYVNTESLTAESSETTTYYAVFAERSGSEPVEQKTQTLQYDTWTYSGSTTDKSSYRLFHKDSYIESEAFDLSKLTKVIVYGGTFGGNSYNSLTIGDGTNTWKSVEVSGSSQTGTNTYTGGTALTGTGKLRITSNSGSASSNGIRISKVEIFTMIGGYTYSNYCTTIVTKQLISISLSGEYPIEFWKGETFSHEGMTVTAHYNNADDADVTSKAEFSDPDMATAGVQTVTVTYDAKSTTYDITVKTIANNMETAYTVTEAKSIIDANPAELAEVEVYVKGKISKVDSYNSTYKSITYWISEDGTTTNQFEVYGGLKSNAEDAFTSKDDVKVGADVIICGKIKNYKGTYEFDANNYLVYYNLESYPATISSVGFATLYLEFDAAIPTNVTAYTATYAEKTITLHEIEGGVIPAETAVVLKGEAGDYDFEESLYTGEPLENALCGTTEESSYEMLQGTETDKYVYTLNQGDNGVGFFHMTNSETSKLAANRAYLLIPVTDFEGGAGTIGFRFGDATQIENVNAVEAGKYYDLMGREVLNPAGGIYILNGKKVLVK